jgi:hypothetical protein
MYRVAWLEAAVAQVAEAWVDADSSLRAAITAAANEIDATLREAPYDTGESRSEGRRLLIVPPLGAVFHIDAQRRTVVILRAWVFRRRP